MWDSSILSIAQKTSCILRPLHLANCLQRIETSDLEVCWPTTSTVYNVYLSYLTTICQSYLTTFAKLSRKQKALLSQIQVLTFAKVILAYKNSSNTKLISTHIYILNMHLITYTIPSSKTTINTYLSHWIISQGGRWNHQPSLSRPSSHFFPQNTGSAGPVFCDSAADSVMAQEAAEDQLI